MRTDLDVCVLYDPMEIVDDGYGWGCARVEASEVLSVVSAVRGDPTRRVSVGPGLSLDELVALGRL